MRKKQFNILIVEDEPAHAELVSRAFEVHGDKFRLSVTGCLTEARAYLKQYKPDLVLVDLVLPDGKGSSLLPVGDEKALFPVVVMTSHGDEHAAVEAMKAGALDYIVKSEVTLADMPHIAVQALREWDHIIKRKQAEASLAEEKERLAVTLRSIGDGVITTDAQGRITMVNKVAENLTGWSQAEALGKPLETVFKIVNENTRERCHNPVTKVLETGGIVGLANNTVLVSKNGTECVIADSGAPILDKHNRTLGVVLVFRDVTEKRRIAQELQKVQKIEALGVLAGGIAHDFNNALTAIIGNISLAKIYAKPEDRVFEKLEEVEQAAMRTKDLTQQLLTFSKGGEPVKRIVSLAGLLKDSVSFALRGSNVSCSFDIPENLWPVKIDSGQIGQVINNIILNADQSMPEGGLIEIHAQNVSIDTPHLVALRAGRYVKISFRDKGIGIPKEHLSKIFDPYFSTKQKGSGIGLAVAYSIIEKHAGYITAESHVGSGTTFHVYLPAPESPPMQEKEVQFPILHGVGKVLLMDDEMFIRDVGSEMLRAIGYQVVCARDGAEALALYRQAQEAGQTFDVCILDLTIPGGKGGKDTVRDILAIDPDATVIVSSGYSNDPIMSQFKQYGFRGAVSKPYRIQELSEILHAAHGKKPDDRDA